MALPFKITFAQIMSLLGVGLGLGVANIAPPAALTAEAMWALGLLCLLYTSPSPRDA